MTKYRVIDSIMGSGKTTKIIEELQHADPVKNRFLVITPYLPEVDRITKAVPELCFKTPSDSDSSKLSALHKLLETGENVVSTHALFKRWNHSTLKALKSQRYELIIDETIDCIREYGSEGGELSSGDIMMLVDSGQIIIDDNNRLLWESKRRPAHKSVYAQLMEDCDAGRLYCMGLSDDSDGVMFWEFPIDLLNVFQSVTILTYLFSGSLMAAYLEGNDVSPDRLMIDDNHNLVDWTQEREDQAIAPVAALINLLDDDKLNEFGKEKGAFSSNWMKKQTSKSLETIKKTTYNVLQNRFKANRDTVMWSCVKAYKDDLCPRGYKNGYIACNARATNEYRNRYHLAYLRNIYMTPTLWQFYKNMRGVDPSNDAYALAELLQWVFRSAIRDGKPIDLYLPSSRMRKLLKDWMSAAAS